MSSAAVSVVIPSYNCGPYVVQAVESVLAQTRPVAEIIVIDDGSRDDTRARLEPYADRVRYVYQDNAGVSAARNHGLRLASGEFVGFLDADDAWHPRKLEFQLKVMEEHPELAMVGAALMAWPGTFPDLSEPGVRDLTWVTFRRLAIKNCLATSALLVRREHLTRAGEFDTSLSGPEDYDMWLRISMHAPAANLKLPLTGYRYVAGSLSKQAARMEEGMRRILAKLDKREAWRGQGVLLRRQAYAYCDYSCGLMYAAAGERGKAYQRIVRSLGRYPLPYGPGIMRIPFGRLRLLAALLWKSVRPDKRSTDSPKIVESGRNVAAVDGTVR